MDSSSNCRFEALVPHDLPSKAQLWTSQMFYDGAGWQALPEKEKIALKPTTFADNRLLFLEPHEGLVNAFKDVQSGKFDVKCWSKLDRSLGIEGDKTVFLKTPNLKEVAVYVHPERLPTFPRTWKPLVFIASESVVSFRLTENLCLLATLDNTGTVQVQCIDYNGGFLCSHPGTGIALVYGSYIVKGINQLPNCMGLPRIQSSCGDWGYFVQYFPWGTLVIPKSIDLLRPGFVPGAIGLGKKVDCVGILFHPPKMFLLLHIESPKIQRNLTYGADFLITSQKVSETDINIYLVMDGQLILYNYSFDIRVNKPDKPQHNENIYFKCTIDDADKKKPNPKLHFVTAKNQTVLVSQGCPYGTSEHLVSSELIALYDAEICMHYTHPPALSHTKVFETVAVMPDPE